MVYSQIYSDWTAIPGISFTDVANKTTVQPGNKDPVKYVDCIRGMLRSSVIKVSGEIDTRPWVAVRETGSDNLKVCPLLEGQWDSCSVKRTMCHRANPSMDSLITLHFICWLTTFCHHDTMAEITSVSLKPTFILKSKSDGMLQPQIIEFSTGLCYT